ncbi:MULTISPECIES: hypothetical protein [unclassified Paenibacillus]|uniref:hypothetical protein n=1 Tax=unclassified Paenibacillus TaxID=185978 RepID=UPI0036D3E697
MQQVVIFFTMAHDPFFFKILIVNGCYFPSTPLLYHGLTDCDVSKITWKRKKLAVPHCNPNHPDSRFLGTKKQHFCGSCTFPPKAAKVFA